MLSELYRAEEAALEGFSLLADASFVDADKTFLGAMAGLVEDERAHMNYYENIRLDLSLPDFLPPAKSSEEFWTSYQTGKYFRLPLKSGVAALFCLFGEGLGYAFLHNLGSSLSDPPTRMAFFDHLRDERRHLRTSITVLDRALRAETTNTRELWINGLGYALLAGRAARTQRKTLEDLGFDYFDIIGSSVRFVHGLLEAVDALGPSERRWLTRAIDQLTTPASMRFAYAGMHLPMADRLCQVLCG